MDNSKKVLVMGIVGLVLAFDVTIAGIIVSALALNEYKKFAATGGIDKKATVGKNLATAGLIVGIVFTAIYLIIFLAIGCAAAGSAVYSNYNALAF